MKNKRWTPADLEICKDARRQIIEIGLVKILSASMACHLVTNRMHHEYSWCIMSTRDASWVPMMHHEYSWCIMGTHDASWVLMMLHEYILGGFVMLKYYACHQKSVFGIHPWIPRIHMIQPIVSLNSLSGAPSHTRRGSGWRDFKTKSSNLCNVQKSFHFPIFVFIIVGLSLVIIMVGIIGLVSQWSHPLFSFPLFVSTMLVVLTLVAFSFICLFCVGDIWGPPMIVWGQFTGICGQVTLQEIPNSWAINLLHVPHCDFQWNSVESTRTRPPVISQQTISGKNVVLVIAYFARSPFPC